MINHISIGVNQPENVANVIAEIWGGVAMPFPPSPGGFVVLAGDDRGSLVEVVPTDVNLIPGKGEQDEVDVSIDTDTSAMEAVFVAGNETTRYNPVHLNITTPFDADKVKAIAKREGWRCITANRDNGLFQLIEVWIENRFMLEVMTAEMTDAYRKLLAPENWASLLESLGAPAQAASANSAA